MKLRGEGRVGADRESYVCFLSVLSVAVLPISALPVADLQTGMSVLSVAVLSMSVWVCLGLFGSVLPVADLQTGMVLAVLLEYLQFWIWLCGTGLC